MARASAVATLSQHTGLLTTPNPTKLVPNPFSLPPSLPFLPRHPFLSHHDIILLKSPATNICYAQLDCSISEEAEDSFDVFSDGDDMIQDDDDEDETESSMDLLFRFLQSLFKKLSKRAKKATRSMLPGAISPQLLSFAVDGILLLAALSIVKSFLEVVCTLGSSVFVAILLLRVIWAAISYFQSNGNTFNQDGSSLGMI